MTRNAACHGFRRITLGQAGQAGYAVGGYAAGGVTGTVERHQD